MLSCILRNLRLPAGAEQDLTRAVKSKLRLPEDSFQLDRILRRSLDTRRKGHPVYDYTLLLSFPGQVPHHPDLQRYHLPQPPPQKRIPAADPHPFILGMGPAGLFCALAMVQSGLRPWLFDRGDSLELRSAKVGEFWLQGVLDTDSNVQFGEGGAGAWSDGKLTCRSDDPFVSAVYAELIRFGAPEEIAWLALPHLGSEGVRSVVRNIRDFLQEQGCRFFYRSPLLDLELREGRVARVLIGSDWYEPELLVLALGNSARDTWHILKRRGILPEPKPFAVGFRIEQKQAVINRLIYGSEDWAAKLGAAAYRLTSPTGYTFCMCPGGFVIGAASEKDGVVTNGMSFSRRNGVFCNSAIVTPVSDRDCGSGIWAGVNLQRSLERGAWRSGFLAPAQRAEDFLAGSSSPRKPLCNYLPDVYPSALDELLPRELSSRLRSALLRFDQLLPGFAQDAVLIAPETRTSSPVRFPRHKENLHCLSANNLYPIGEGSGYSGGIVSSAADGWRLGARLRLGDS